jgi:hypothetical protein
MQDLKKIKGGTEPPSNYFRRVWIKPEQCVDLIHLILLPITDLGLGERPIPYENESSAHHGRGRHQAVDRVTRHTHSYCRVKEGKILNRIRYHRRKTSP